MLICIFSLRIVSLLRSFIVNLHFLLDYCHSYGVFLLIYIFSLRIMSLLRSFMANIHLLLENCHSYGVVVPPFWNHKKFMNSWLPQLSIFNFCTQFLQHFFGISKKHGCFRSEEQIILNTCITWLHTSFVDYNVFSQFNI